MPMPDIVGKYAQGFDYSQAKAEQARRQPIIEQLDQMKLRQGEQSIKQGEQRSTLQDMLIKDNNRKKESEDMADFGKGAAWAMNQADPNAAWDQVLTQYEKEGKPVDQFRNRSDLMPMVRDLNNPDYAKQQAIQQNLTSLVQTLPQDKRAGFSALSSVSPQAAAKAYGENLFAGDTTGQLEQLTATLPKNQQAQVAAVYAADPDEAVKLTKDLIKQQEKPKSATELKEEIKSDAAFQDLKLTNEKFKSMLADPVFSESVGPIDQYTADIGAAFGSESGVMKKKAERAVRGLVRGLVASFPGSLSEKELTALESEMPKTSDSIEIWSDWFENDFTPSYKLAREKAGRSPETGQSSAINDLVNKYAD